MTGLAELALGSLRTSRRLLAVSVGALLLVVVLTLAVYPGVRDAAGLNDAVSGIPEQLRTSLGLQDLVSPVGYLRSQLLALTLPVALVALGTALGVRAVAGEEETGRLGVLLAGPVTRRRVLLVRTGAAVTGVLATAGLVWLTLLAGGALLDLRVGPLDLLAAVWACAALASLHVTLAVAVGGLTGSRGAALGLTSLVGVAGWLTDSLLPLVPGAERGAAALAVGLGAALRPPDHGVRPRGHRPAAAGVRGAAPGRGARLRPPRPAPLTLPARREHRPGTPAAVLPRHAGRALPRHTAAPPGTPTGPPPVQERARR